MTFFFSNSYLTVLNPSFRNLPLPLQLLFPMVTELTHLYPVENMEVELENFYSHKAIFLLPLTFFPSPL